MKLNYDTADKNMKLLGQSVQPKAIVRLLQRMQGPQMKDPSSPASSSYRESKELYSFPWKSNNITRNQFHT